MTKRYKNYEDVINRVYDKIYDKTSKMSDLIEKEKSHEFPLYDELEDEWEKYCSTKGVCAKDLYPYKEKRDIQSIYNSHKNHPSIQIPTEAKKIVDYIKLNTRTEKELLQKICEWIYTYIEYDTPHATASRLYKQGKNKIYMNATETFNTRIGICGETSLLTIGMLSNAGIPSTIYRPWFSHIAVIAKTITNQHYMIDSTYDRVTTTEPITEKTSKESYYELGVSNVNENYKYNWEKRRVQGLQFGLKYYNRILSTEELLDVERAHLCEPLKYGTIVGMIEQQKILPLCKKLEKERLEEEKRQKEQHNYYNYHNYYEWINK